MGAGGRERELREKPANPGVALWLGHLPRKGQVPVRPDLDLPGPSQRNFLLKGSVLTKWKKIKLSKS